MDEKPDKDSNVDFLDGVEIVDNVDIDNYCEDYIRVINSSLVDGILLKKGLDPKEYELVYLLDCGFLTIRKKHKLNRLEIKLSHPEINWNKELKDYSNAVWGCVIYYYNESYGGYFPSNNIKDGKLNEWLRFKNKKKSFCRYHHISQEEYYYVLDREYQNRHKRLQLYSSNLKYVLRKESFFLTFEYDNDKTRMKKRNQFKGIDEITFRRRVIECLNTLNCDYIVYPDHMKNGKLHFHAVVNYQGRINATQLWKYGNLDLGLKSGKIPALFTDDGLPLYEEMVEEDIKMEDRERLRDSGSLSYIIIEENNDRLNKVQHRFIKCKNYLFKFDIVMNHATKESVQNARIIYSPSLRERNRQKALFRKRMKDDSLKSSHKSVLDMEVLRNLSKEIKLIKNHG